MIPFFMIFKLFGVVNQREMTEMILEDSVNSEDPIAQQLKTIIQ